MENTQINDNSNDYIYKVYMTLMILLGFTAAVIWQSFSTQNAQIVNQGSRPSQNLVTD